jgi:hypothetical protein
MPNHLKGYVYVMILALIVFALVRKPITASIVSADDFRRRRNAWLLVTTIVFVAHNFWVYAFATGVVAWLLMQRDRNPMAAYVTLLFAVPLFKFPISGLGVVNVLLVMDHQRLLALVLLLPLAYRHWQKKERVDTTTRVVSLLVAAHYLQGVIAYAVLDSFTQGMRFFVTEGLSLWLCYYVAAHAIGSIRALREVMIMFVVGLSVLGLIGMFESVRGWLIYESLRLPLGAFVESSTAYFTRDSGFGIDTLRALTTTGHAIIFGYICMIALCFWTAFRDNMGTRLNAYLVLGLLLAGLVSSLSRGPWVGAIAGMSMVLLSGRGLVKRLGILAMALMVVGLGVLASPYADKFLAFVPFFGSVGAESADYRVKLFEVSMIVFWDSPWVGHFDVVKDPRMEVMRQGQGIIDMVNTYLGIGLQYGFVGLTTFVVPHALVLWGLFKTMREAESVNPTVAVTGRALFGAIVGSLVTLATASTYDFVPIVYWTLLGLGVSYTVCTRRVIQQHQTAQVQAMVAARGRASSRTPTSGGRPPLIAPR